MDPVLVAICLTLGPVEEKVFPRVPDAFVTHVDVFSAGEAGYFAFRIPAVEATPEGILLAFAEARKYNLNDPGFGKQDIDLVLKRSSDGGLTWSELQVIEDPGELWSAANPATVFDRSTGRVWVFYIRCRPERSTHTARAGTDDVLVLARWSEDNGKTWSKPVDLTPVARDYHDPTWRMTVPGPGGAIQSRTGRLLVPAWKVDGWNNFVIFSDDHGRSWQRSTFVPGGKEGNENQLVELGDGRILMDIRQTKGSHRWRSISSDQGQTWSEPSPGHEVTPVACAIERYPGGGVAGRQDLIVWTGPKGPGRQTLTLHISEDGGQTFSRSYIITDGPAAYSDLTFLPHGNLAILWERDQYRRITLTMVSKEFFQTLGQ
jgi:sialidase-1